MLDTKRPQASYICQKCGSTFARRTGKTKFCSLQCRLQVEHDSYRKRNPKAKTNTHTTGAVGELAVAIDLLKKGFHIFRALSPACPCDLIALKEGTSIRIEVTTGHYSPKKRIIFHRRSTERYDLLAVVTHDGRILYSASPSNNMTRNCLI